MIITKEYKYKFTYKIINLINKKYYYGVHFSNRLKDGYKGSGRLIKKAQKKYGKENLILIYLEFFKTIEDAYKGEAKLITKEDLMNPMCYNLSFGGNGFPPLSNKDILKLKQLKNNKDLSMEDIDLINEKIYTYEQANKKRSLASKGYNNPDFITNTKPKYESMKEDFLFLCTNTSLYDYDIKQILVQKYNYGFKWPKLCKYFLEQKYYDSIQIEKKNDESTFSNIVTQKSILNNNKNYIINIVLLYENIHEYFNKYISYLLDENYSDSYLIQNLFYGNNISLYKVINYFSNLGLIKVIGKKKINIKTICVNSHKVYSTKTIIEINPTWKQTCFILKKYEYNKNYIFSLFINENNLPQLTLSQEDFNIFSLRTKQC